MEFVVKNKLKTWVFVSKNTASYDIVNELRVLNDSRKLYITSTRSEIKLPNKTIFLLRSWLAVCQTSEVQRSMGTLYSLIKYFNELDAELYRKTRGKLCELYVELFHLQVICCARELNGLFSNSNLSVRQRHNTPLKRVDVPLSVLFTLGAHAFEALLRHYGIMHNVILIARFKGRLPLFQCCASHVPPLIYIICVLLSQGIRKSHFVRYCIFL